MWLRHRPCARRSYRRLKPAGLSNRTAEKYPTAALHGKRASAQKGSTRLASRHASFGTAVIVAAVALSLGVEVTRLTVANEFASTRPDVAFRLAPNAPATLSAVAMREVGEAAAKGGVPSREAFRRLEMLSAVAPLEPAPFLVEAALAEREADYGRAERLLQQARVRGPRSIATRYLLADVSLRNGEVAKGLRQLAILSRLLPSTSVQLVPALSDYARTPGAERELAGVLAENEQLKRPLLVALSADPANAELVLRLAGGDVRQTDVETQAWKTRLLNGLISRGDYERSYALWRRFSGAPAGPRPFLYNGEFKRLAAPPPFNWDFSSSSAGVAEPDNGRLRVLYYGRDPTSLASQLLLLPPGQYRFESLVTGQMGGGSLRWIIQCVGGGGQPGDVTIAEPGMKAIQFTVPPAKCDAQWLELRGVPQDAPQQADVQIGSATIRRTGA